MKNIMRLLLLLVSTQANAGLIVTLYNNGYDGVIANFNGSGVTSGVTSNQTAQFFNIGEYTTTTAALFELETYIGFGTSNIVLLGISDDTSTTDDFGFISNSIIEVGTPYDVNASSLVKELSYRDLIEGVYSTNILGGVQIDNFQLIVRNSLSVSEPTKISMLAIGLFGLAFRRKQAIKHTYDKI
jgi:hypothetical protein